jgi:hypothetical protein
MLLDWHLELSHRTVLLTGFGTNLFLLIFLVSCTKFHFTFHECPQYTLKTINIRIAVFSVAAAVKKIAMTVKKIAQMMNAPQVSLATPTGPTQASEPAPKITNTVFILFASGTLLSYFNKVDDISHSFFFFFRLGLIKNLRKLISFYSTSHPLPKKKRKNQTMEFTKAPLLKILINWTQSRIQPTQLL